MRTKFSALIALLCILVYVAAVLSAAYRVYISIEEQQRSAAEELGSIETLIAKSDPGFFPDTREAIQKKINDCRVVKAIIITGSQGILDFEQEQGSFIRGDGGNPRFTTRFGYTTLKARELDIPGFRNVNIYPFINTINYEYLAHVLRQTLLAIMAGLVLSFFTMIISLLRSRGTEAAENSRDTAGDTGEEPRVKETPDIKMDDDFFDDFDIPETETETETSPLDGDNSISETTDNTNDFDLPDFDTPAFDNPAADSGDTADSDDFKLDDFLDESDLDLPKSEETPPSASDVSAAAPSAASPSGENPKGLYSPRSGIGWEAYTQDRLASELHRCAASEQDLVILLMECGDGVNCDSRLFKKIADETVDLFNLRDLSFEYKNRGITVIIPNADLEQGIAKAEKFHARLLNTCFDSIHAKNDFLIGISSRSGRLIEADRLLLEASRALEKAKVESGSPIVAFKSDPEKYRDFIRKGSSDT
ncbi:hypothetical protein AGMMS50230_19290 [Spirochaetia bacterium]|nr:hypothetical protein AGMMS50230_19290 [Spirochaetia bacterium]